MKWLLGVYIEDKVGIRDDTLALGCNQWFYFQIVFLYFYDLDFFLYTLEMVAML